MEQIDLFEDGMLEWPEEWRPVKGYEGLYEVSNKGRVRSFHLYRGLKTKYHVRNPTIGSHGYYFISLYKNGKEKRFSIHRLVAESFIDNPNNYPEINHKDEDKSNNCVENLEWCSHIYNCRYGTRNIRTSVIKTKKIINQYDLNNNLLATYRGLSDASKKTGFNKSNISFACIKHKTSHGYIWRYAE